MRVLPAATLAWVMGLACNGHLDFDAGPRSAPGGASGAGAGGAGGAASCRADTDCRLTGATGTVSLHCDPSQGGACVECVSDGHCGRAGARRCETSLRRCVACLVAGDCATGQTCLANRCVSTCAGSTAGACPVGTDCEDGLCAACEADDAKNCATSAGNPYCLATALVCVGCRSDADCGASTPRCDPVRKACVACVSARDCPARAPFCEPTAGACVPGA